MRAGEVMMEPVVTVRPEMRVKEAAAVLVERGISGAPVVDVAASDGMVVLAGPPDPSSRRLAELLARGISGVVEVEFADRP